MHVDDHSSSATAVSNQKSRTKSVLKHGAVATVLAVVANAAVYLVGKAIIDVPDDFMPMENAGGPIFLTIIGLALATGVYLWLARTFSDPHRRFLPIAGVALLLSFIPNLVIYLSKPEDMGTVEGGPVLLLMVMHIVAAAIAVTVLPRSTPN
jgi:uncharacterized membrane protein YozB (DUF420 family)